MREKFNCSNEIVNCNVLKRVSNVNPAHLDGPRPTYEEHIESISCNKDLSSCEVWKNSSVNYDGYWNYSIYVLTRTINRIIC